MAALKRNPLPYPDALKEIVVNGCIDLFSSLGEKISYEGAEPDTTNKNAMFSHSGIIGFAGTEMRGALSICCSSEVLSKTHPMAKVESNLSEDHIGDWMGEIANQLLGRVKNAVLRYGVEFNLSTPTIVRGTNVTVLSIEGAPLLVFWFQHNKNPIAVSFCSILKKGVDFSEVTENDATRLKEGGDILF